MVETNVHGMKFPGYGRCIYCGATSVLKDEHIIPHSLGGTAVILKASCADCEKITSYLDGYLARDIFNEYRSHVGIQSRRKRQRPTTLHASFLKPDGTEEVRSYPAKQQPYTLMMPIWHLPGIVLGKEPSSEFEITQSHVYNFINNETSEWMQAEGAKLGAWPYVNYPTFARAMARIAFCQAVSNRGLDGFNHLDLPALILGKYPHVPHYVGVAREDPPPPDPREMVHKVQIQDFTKDGSTYLMASVRLFAHSGYKDLGMPIYRVILGIPK